MTLVCILSDLAVKWVRITNGKYSDVRTGRSYLKSRSGVGLCNRNADVSPSYISNTAAQLSG
jgi:hypothetical protein